MTQAALHIKLAVDDTRMLRTSYGARIPAPALVVLNGIKATEIVPDPTVRGLMHVSHSLSGREDRGVIYYDFAHRVPVDDEQGSILLALLDADKVETARAALQRVPGVLDVFKPATAEVAARQPAPDAPTVEFRIMRFHAEIRKHGLQ